MSLEAHGFFYAGTVEPMVITEKQFKAYERIRLSGKTNMYDIEVVVKLSRKILTRQMVGNIIRHYDFLRAKYLPPSHETHSIDNRRLKASRNARTR